MKHIPLIIGVACMFLSFANIFTAVQLLIDPGRVVEDSATVASVLLGRILVLSIAGVAAGATIIVTRERSGGDAS
ncbi:hypothetical protein [Pseudomonas sp.]|uniref:hypothetical protein n=1 Tax=Pseudomonas sp. TaxID=306 RepID=UPI002615CDE8|nr:hypothetical protein [Pseudomonas sp.]